MKALPITFLSSGSSSLHLPRWGLLLVIAWMAMHTPLCPAQINPPSRPTAILPIDQVRIGMTGYGLTVFHGDKVEAFPVVVVSVMQDFTPGKGVIWIRSSDPRLQQSGPVHGMSGSPIYLWTDDQSHQLGQGGKLIGAFAFGFQASKDCYAGVQSIQAMRQVGQRAKEQTPPQITGNTAVSGDPTHQLRQLLSPLQQQPADLALTWRGQAILKLLENPRHPAPSSPLLHNRPTLNSSPATSANPPLENAAPLGISGQATPLLLPLNIQSANLATLAAPLLQPLGMIPMQTPLGTQVGKPPKEIDLNKLNLQPGSMLAIPLVWGDLDISASGTVTEVLPDGRVLGFGHAMFGQGPTSLPMAGGFVHYVVPSIISSFKLAGSGAIRGTLVRDEKSAVVGQPEISFQTADVTVAIHRPNAAVRQYQFKVARQKNLTPLLASIAAVESAMTDVTFPIENTIRLRATFEFDRHRQLHLDSLIPMGSDRELFFELAPPMIAMAQNEFETSLLTRLDLRIDVEPINRAASLISVRPDRTQLAPGEVVNLSLTLQSRGQAPQSHRTSFTVPADLPEGDYSLIVCDGQNYLNFFMQNHPHLTYLTGVDELVQMINQVLSVRRNALYLVLQRPEQGLAIGRQELPQLPSSRRAMMAAPTALPTMPYATMTSQIIPLDQVCNGQWEIPLSIRNNYDRRPITR